jgi:hypothetical protein
MILGITEFGLKKLRRRAARSTQIQIRTLPRLAHDIRRRSESQGGHAVVARHLAEARFVDCAFWSNFRTVYYLVDGHSIHSGNAAAFVTVIEDQRARCFLLKGNSFPLFAVLLEASGG